MTDINALVSRDATQWLQSEFSKPATGYLNPLLQRVANGEDLPFAAASPMFWDAMIAGDDQLRQRMVFALSQILVVSDADLPTLTSAHYMDILTRNAFGNYRDLLEEVTYSPAMGIYLTYLYNRKGDPRTGRMPDENYARELMQLFAIGLVELNMDGTIKTNGTGQAIETYDNEDIVGLAKVFTGFAPKGDTFWEKDDDAWYVPMQMYDEQHSELEKTFLGLTIPAETGGEDSVDQALDHIFNHPNVAPFISRQLIQRFTASSPAPAYVERVATAFEAGRYQADNGAVFGAGERGDLRATLAAVLLDETVIGENAGTNPQSGKVREPILRFVQWARAFNVSAVDAANLWQLFDTSSSDYGLSQHPLRSRSVFNFYRPGYVAPGTLSGDAGLTAPEFQIVNEGSLVGYVNFMTDFIANYTDAEDYPGPLFDPDFTQEMALADDPEALADHLDVLLTGGRMQTATKAQIVDVVSTLPLNENPGETNADHRYRRAGVAILMAITSPAYTVQR